MLVGNTLAIALYTVMQGYVWVHVYDKDIIFCMEC